MTASPYDDVRDGLAAVRQSIADACAAAGRDPGEITLVGVTKTVPPDRINAALEAGLTHIGENRVQEFLSKRDALRLQGRTVHLIGHLQTNKVAKIVGEVAVIQSVDSLRLAQRISEASLRRGLVAEVLAEVNIGMEDSKGGVPPQQLEELLGRMGELPGLRVSGLMAVPPALETERDKRAVFSRLYKLFVDIRTKNIDNINMHVLSMGMSGDFREAVLEGSTMVRVGSAIFGPRPPVSYQEHKTDRRVW